MDKTTLLLILLLTPIVLAITIVTITAVKAEEGGEGNGLSEAVKQNPDGTKVRLTGQKIDVDLTKRYNNI